MDKSVSRAKQKKKKERARVNKPQETDRHEINNAAESAFDFGGLPARDLKKNLGCG